MGSVPIYWGEADGFGELLNSAAQAHWARAVIEQSYTIEPVDFLTEEVLARHRILMLAQPRALAATENVALDDWVRGGGRLLLFADPMMTGESRFSIGDRRRPQDVALLSPILAHWGLELRFDADQQAGLRMHDFAGQPIPVNLPGHLAVVEEQGCAAREDGLIAQCALGLGQVIILADAAILDVSGPYPQAEAALKLLIARIFAESGENAGNVARAGQSAAQTHAIPPIPVPPEEPMLPAGSP